MKLFFTQTQVELETATGAVAKNKLVNESKCKKDQRIKVKAKVVVIIGSSGNKWRPS